MPHNNALQRPHLRKDWWNNVRTWFNQPARKHRRLTKRREKAAAIHPRPLRQLRPIVHKPTERYSGQTRLGRGFTLAELKGANVLPQFARTIGIAVDERRVNKSVELMQLNINRLKAYLEKLVLLPRKSGKPRKAGPGQLADSADVSNLVQNTEKKVMAPQKARLTVQPQKITKEMNAFRAHSQLKIEMMNKKWAGKRAAKAKEN